jgi:hypothetical protein
MRRSIASGFLAIVAATVWLTAVGGATGGTESASADRCLRGSWRTSRAEANRVLAVLTGGTMTVAEGRLTAGFNATRMTYGSTHFVVRIQQGDFLLEGTANFVYEAPYTTRGETIVVGRGRTELFISKFRGENNGRSITVPGPGLTVRRLPAGPVPYKCRADSMNLGIPGHSDDAMRFRRAS